MAAVYDEIEIEDMDWKPAEKKFYYPCPCGDRFSISLEDLLSGEDIARCPSCSLIIRVVCDPEALEERYGNDAADAEPRA